MGTSIISTFASVSPLIGNSSAPVMPMPSRGPRLLARRLDAAFDHEDVGAVAAGIHAVFDHTILVEVQRIEPSVLMHPSHMLAAAAFGRHDHMRNVALGGRRST